ncbi:His Kinase A (phospho-acceptor) domain-containing protein [Desulfonispora thiosulfatigenes DSM 11270]|uniref:histidine kinase n=1 Tax=Desulfonispora thiosulfatigenes DSM 11270 TaxID=656914 RepID=A0A1W1VH81_DESTI|nr:sensor histidine kinase [Desulfonispora thiosulfatigenes]SMB92739.1 His Kinase A (phospho-acceptor) domain-containing protein [Desulfonispora thiosulfatigenes DSM 11270]
MTKKSRNNFVLIFVIFLIITSSTLLLKSNEQLKKYFFSENLRHTEEIQRNINNYLNTKINMLAFLASLDQFKNFNVQEIEETLTKTIYSDTDNRTIFVYDKNGKIVSLQLSSTNSEDILNSISFKTNTYKPLEQQNFKTTLEGKICISNILYNLDTKIPYIAISVPCFNQKGEIIGGLGLTFDPDNLLKFFSKSDYFQISSLIIDDNGKIITNTPSIYPELLDYDFKALFDLKEKLAVQSSPFNNKKELISYVPITNTDWYIVSTQPYSLIKAELYQASIERSTLILLLLIPLLIFAYLYIKEQEKRNIISIISKERSNSLIEISASLAHRIRNPLVAVKGFISYEKNKTNSTLGQENIDIMLSEINQIEHILSELLKLSHNNHANLYNLCLNDVLLNAYNLMKPQAEIKNIVFKLHLPEENLYIQGNENLIIDLFINIVRNSFAATQKKGIVTIKLLKLRDSVQIIFTDNGPGIPDEFIKHIGNPFSTKSESLGLGLAICDKIIKLHDGIYSIKGDPTLGTIFTISFPTKK